MTTDDARTSWLIDEIDESLDAGPVGLYEFVWTLRGRSPDASTAELKTTSATALERLRARRQLQLVYLQWPQSAPMESAAWVDIDSAAWDDIGPTGRYLAVTDS